MSGGARPARSAQNAQTAQTAQTSQTSQTAAGLLRASGLPQRWRGRERFVVLDSDFGCGHAFVEIWRSWRADPGRCGWLSVVAVCARMPAAEELPPVQAAADDPARCLRQAWPPATPDLHTLAFERGRVQLLLAVGDLRSRLPALRVQADALFVRASAIVAEPECAERMGRKAATGATLAIDVDSRDAGDIRHVLDPGHMEPMWAALRSSSFVIRAGNGVGGDRDGAGDRGGGIGRDEQAVDSVVTADHAPRFQARRLPDAAVTGRSAVVVGAGIGGAAVALALARSGFEVTVLDRHPRAASEASGNPAGLFHGVVHAGDGRYSRLYRAAALRADAVYAQAIDGDGVPGNANGLLRVVPPPGDLASMQALLVRSGLPPSHLQALDRDAASALAGVPLAHPAWFYPGGGWIDPGAWVRHALAQPGVRFVASTAVARVSARSGDTGDAGDHGWQVHDGSGAILARAAIVVLAPGAAGTSLAPMAWPLLRSRGQLTCWSGSPSGPTPLRMALAGAGYALPLPDGGLACGATNDPATGEHAVDREPDIRASDHHHNLQRLLALCGLRPPPDAVFHERTGWRLSAADRLPIAGPLPLDAITGAVVGKRDQCRMLPRARGLFALTALGSRGLTWAPLLGELIAAQACGAPWPLPQDLADAIDPARWTVRAARLAQQA